MSTILKTLTPMLLATLAVGCGVPTATPSPESQVNEFVAENNRVFAQAIHMSRVERGKTQKAIVIDLMHIAPEGYYRRIKETMRRIARENRGTVILEEGVKDERKTVYRLVGDNLKKFGRVLNRTSFSQVNSQSLINSWVAKRYLKEVPKPLISELEMAYRMVATQFDLETQKDAEISSIPGAKKVMGDIKLSNARLGDQFVVDMISSCVSITENLDCERHKILKWTEKEGDGTIIDLRNRHLLSQVERQLRKTSTVIMPWGAKHNPDLVDGLKRRGFKKVRTENIDMVSCREARSNLALRQNLYKDVCKKGRSGSFGGGSSDDDEVGGFGF